MEYKHLIIIIISTFVCWNMYQYNRSFDNCEKLLAEVHTNLKTLHSELSSLQVYMGAGAVNHE